jgi:hypothetical protein
MRRLLLLGILLVAGCQNVLGPFQRPGGRVDNPCLTIGEQGRISRDRLALPDTEGNRVGVSGGLTRPWEVAK